MLLIQRSASYRTGGHTSGGERGEVGTDLLIEQSILAFTIYPGSCKTTAGPAPRAATRLRLPVIAWPDATGRFGPSQSRDSATDQTAGPSRISRDRPGARKANGRKGRGERMRSSSSKRRTALTGSTIKELVKRILVE